MDHILDPWYLKKSWTGSTGQSLGKVIKTALKVKCLPSCWQGGCRIIPPSPAAFTRLLLYKPIWKFHLESIDKASSLPPRVHASVSFATKTGCFVNTYTYCATFTLPAHCSSVHQTLKLSVCRSHCTQNFRLKLIQYTA